ncbi:MAG TPA: HD domain-containing protein [Polyangiaceae bacterium]|nr:HD domain-containing protein [Polyangiaceae bacterium]
MVPDFSIARRDELLALLEALRGVAQPVRYHPEGDALFHSLQVFEQARTATDDPELWAAALFHDVGKAIDGKTHDEVGADLLAGLVSERVIWLVRHHLDLLREPKRTRRAHHGTAALADLECLRRWDLAGRKPCARVLATEDAVELWLDQENERNSFADIDP